MGTELATEAPRRSNGWIGCVGEMVTTSAGYTDQFYTSGIHEDAAIIPVRPRVIAVTEPIPLAIANGVAIAELPFQQPAMVEATSGATFAVDPAKWWQLENL